MGLSLFGQSLGPSSCMTLEFLCSSTGLRPITYMFFRNAFQITWLKAAKHSKYFKSSITGHFGYQEFLQSCPESWSLPRLSLSSDYLYAWHFQWTSLSHLLTGSPLSKLFALEFWPVQIMDRKFRKCILEIHRTNWSESIKPLASRKVRGPHWNHFRELIRSYN
jgi:hypothetical protein